MNYFIDLGANIGQSLELYRDLYPEKVKKTIAFSLEASIDPRVKGELHKKIKNIKKDYEAIIFLNNAISGNNKPLTFWDGNGEGSTASKDKAKKMGLISSFMNFVRFIKKFFIKKGNYLYLRKRYVSAVNILDLIPYQNNDKYRSIDCKIDIEGSEYFVIDSLYKASKLNVSIFDNLFIEVHGFKCGASYKDDYQLIKRQVLIKKCFKLGC